jgi:hypothetical protein
VSTEGTEQPADDTTAAPRRRPSIDAAIPKALLVAAIAAPGLVVFIFPMISLITRNEEYFGGAYSAGRWIYLAGLAMVLVGIALWALRRTRVGEVAFVAYLMITPAYLVYALLAEVTRSAVLAVVSLIAIAAAVLVVRSHATKALRAVAIVSVVILVANGASAILEAQSPPADTADEPADGAKPVPTAPPVENRASGAGLPNVYHVILDEYQSDQFDLAVDDEDRAALAGFTYFPDAVTTYGRTEMAVADMFSQEEYDYSSPPNDFVNEALLGKTSAIQRMRAAGYDTTGYIQSRSLYAKSTPFDDVKLAADAARSDPGSDYADLATSIWVDASAPDAITQRVIPQRHYDQLSNKALLPDDEPAIAVQAFGSFLNREAQLAPTGRYTLIHLIVPHKPYVLDERCTYTPGAETDGVQQAGCALTLMDQLIAELKQLGRFDSSMIVIQGDHGAGLAREGDQLDEVKQDFYGVPWSTGRSRPLLLVKPAGTTSADPMATSDRPALTTDIVPTIFDSVGLPDEPASGRASLIAAEFPDRPQRYYHFYDKSGQGLPEGKVVRFAVDADGQLSKGESISVPSP